MSKIKKYGPNQRGQMENAENAEVIATDLPGERFSEKVQVTSAKDSITPASAVSGSGEKRDIVAKQLTEIANKVKVKPTSQVNLLNDTQVGGVPIGSGQAVTRSAAGASGGVTTVVDSSKIPYTDGGYRPDSRFAKKTADNDFLINNTISEQIVPKFEGTKDLRESPDSVQGYNGHKQFKTARGKKNAGSLPQSILFDRSIDYMKVDSTIHTTGQVLDNIEARAGYPTKRALNNLKLGDDGYENIESPMEKSNYLLKTFEIKVKNRKISGFHFNEDKCVSHINPDVTYQANMNWQVDRNNVAKTVVRLQKELGRETTDKWSPLGYVIHQPYEYNMLAHDIEATTGAIQTLAYRANVTALAHQFNNKLSKDGAKVETPIYEMFLDGIGQVAKSINPNDITNSNFESLVFNKDLYRAGSAAAIIKMFDSTGKYKTKANFINLPRSLKYFVQGMDNNINPLHCKKEFLMALDTAHMYSTPDGEYNPMLPIITTDKISIVNPLSLNRFLDGWSRDNITSENRSGTADIYTYKYGDIRNVYSWSLKHPIVEGLLTWILKHEDAFIGTYLDNNDKNEEEITITIPAFFSMLAPSMFQCMLAAASQEVLWARNIYFRDFLFAGDQGEYIWDDLEGLNTLNPLYSSNMTITDYKSDIKMGKLKSASFIQTYWNDALQVAGSSPTFTDEITLFAPWYFNEVSTTHNYTDHAGFSNVNGRPYTMSFPEVRQGVCHDYIDTLFDLTERDVRLSLDRMISLPVRYNPIAENGNNTYKITNTVSDINDHVKIGAVRYDHNSDGRVVIAYTNQNFVPTKASLMCAPREIGFIYSHLRVCPIIHNITANNNAFNYDTVGTYKLSAPLDGSMGYSLVCYAAKGRDNNTETISRTAALQQDFCTIFADRTTSLNENSEAIATVGVLPALSLLISYNDDVEDTGLSTFCTTNPFYVLNSNTNKTDLPHTEGLVTLSRALWTLQNKFFMPINVFENIDKTATNEDGTLAAAGALIDPLEGSFMFGLAGFLASDFEQDVLDRADKYDMLQLDYTEDEFIKSSRIFRAD